MPQLQTVDLSPKPREQPTALETTLSAFSQRKRANQLEEMETDALRDIYSQYQADGKNLQKTIQDIQTRPGISPTTRVKSVEQLLAFQKHNAELQASAKKQQDETNKQTANKQIIADLEKRRNLKTGELAAYENDPKMAEQVTRPAKEGKQNQADRPIDQDQLNRIEAAMNAPAWEKASNTQKQRMLTQSGVSTANQKPIMDSLSGEATTKKEGDKLEYDVAKNIHDMFSAEIKDTSERAQKGKAVLPNLDTAIVNNERYSPSEKLWDTTLEAIGSPFLAQFKSKTGQELETITPIAIFSFGAKLGGQLTNAKMNAIAKKSVGLGKDKDANRMILYLDKYDRELDILKNRITKEIIGTNRFGLAPQDFDQQIEERMAPYQKMIAHDLDRLLNNEKPNSPLSHKMVDGSDITYKMRAPDGREFNVPYSKMNKAVTDGLEFAGS